LDQIKVLIGRRVFVLLFFLQKLGQVPAAGTAGPYLQGHYSYPAAQGGMVAPNGMMPMYPFYHYQYHGAQGLGVPAAHFFPPVSAAAVAPTPAIIPKPTVMAAPPKGSNINSAALHYMCPMPRHFLSCQVGMAGTGNMPQDLLQLTVAFFCTACRSGTGDGLQLKAR
jgi:hypothetical protein